MVTGVVDLREDLWGLYGAPYYVSEVLGDLARSTVDSKGGFVSEDGGPVSIWVVNSGESLSGSSERRVEMLRSAVVNRQWFGEYRVAWQD